VLVYIPSELPNVTRVQHGSGDHILRQPQLYGCAREGAIRGRAHETYRHTIFLNVGPRRQRRRRDSAELYANVLTKPLQGSQFVYERGCLTGWPSAKEEESELSQESRGPDQRE
jgi:hypothetical protein